VRVVESSSVSVTMEERRSGGGICCCGRADDDDDDGGVVGGGRRMSYCANWKRRRWRQRKSDNYFASQCPK